MYIHLIQCQLGNRMIIEFFYIIKEVYSLNPKEKKESYAFVVLTKLPLPFCLLYFLSRERVS